ncbi:unnamed protein product [Prorocentrum cordatum]|uniref:Non-specific serine/threonine protein kinase n=1 Tax=Prorocentrum cordatum TaxID=2364126 RepID=A0ABN9QCB0_9DINO|nr:unnamed protein product [Polarella glacialis]
MTKCRRVLKTLEIASSGEEAEWDMVLNEMNVYLRLDHPNVCRLLEVFLDDSACHLVMELCTGKDLCARWESRGAFSEKDACSAVGQMMDAVQYLHGNQIVHRDLKLENWVYADSSANARLKLIDFGFSEVFSHDAPMTAVLGTIFYVAPEVLEQYYDSKCDVWSLGGSWRIAYMLLCGLPPFGGFADSDDDIVLKILDGSDADMEGPRWNGISDSAKAFVSELLTRDPVERPSAQDAALHPWLAGRATCQHSGAREINLEVLESLRSFASMNTIKRAACSLMANSMSVAETDELQAQFKRLDTRQNGTILVQDLVEVLRDRLGMSVAEATELSSNLNPGQEQCLHYSDFLAAVTQRRILAQEPQIRRAFQRFDADQTGYISLENLRAALGNEFQGVAVEEILDQADELRDGVIRYEEFLRAMMDLGSSTGSASPAGREGIRNISRAWDFTSAGRFAPRRRLKRRFWRGQARGVTPSFAAKSVPMASSTIQRAERLQDQDSEDEEGCQSSFLESFRRWNSIDVVPPCADRADLTPPVGRFLSEDELDVSPARDRGRGRFPSGAPCMAPLDELRTLPDLVGRGGSGAAGWAARGPGAWHGCGGASQQGAPVGEGVTSALWVGWRSPWAESHAAKLFN